MRTTESMLNKTIHGYNNIIVNSYFETWIVTEVDKSSVVQ